MERHTSEDKLRQSGQLGCWEHPGIFTWLKNKIQQRKFEDLIGFIKWFMNGAASHLVRREIL